MHGICPEPKMTKFNTKILNFDVLILKTLWHRQLISYLFFIRT